MSKHKHEAEDPAKTVRIIASRLIDGSVYSVFFKILDCGCMSLERMTETSPGETNVAIREIENGEELSDALMEFTDHAFEGVKAYTQARDKARKERAEKLRSLNS